MKKLWEAIKPFMLQIVIVGVLILVVCQQCSYNRGLKDEVNVLKNNITALTDTVHHSQTKNGDLMATITAYQSDLKGLEAYSTELADRIRDYQNTTHNNVTSAEYIETITQLPGKDTVIIDTVYKKEHYTVTHDFDFSDNYRTLTGSVSASDSALSVRVNPEVIHTNITAGIDENSQVFVTTDNPYVRIENLKGFTVPKRTPSKWSVGLQGGFGAQYNKHGVTVGPQVGIGVNYNLFGR